MISLWTWYQPTGSPMLVVEHVNFMLVADEESEHQQVISVLAAGHHQYPN